MSLHSGGMYIKVYATLCRGPPSIDNAVDSFQTSTYHYNHFLQHRFSRRITYSDYCKIEKQVSLIIQEYLKDEQHHYGIILDDIFLDTEGIRKYWSTEKNYVLVRTSLEDKLNIPNYIIVDKVKDYNFL